MHHCDIILSETIQEAQNSARKCAMLMLTVQHITFNEISKALLLQRKHHTKGHIEFPFNKT